jgi:hypothetical protein
MEIGADGLRYRRATEGWLRTELAWELTAALDVEAG